MYIKRIFLIFVILAAAGLFAKTVTVYPREETAVFENPYRGWVTWWQNTMDPVQPCRMVHTYALWRNLETEQGVIDLDKWEKANLAYWLDSDTDYSFILRIVCDYPGQAEHIDVPQYIIDHGNNGVYYNDERLGKGYAPDYNDTFFLERLSNLIFTLGARYNQRDEIAIVQFGTIGHWGEWHVWPVGVSGELPTEANKAKIVGWIKGAFPDKFYGMRYHNEYSSNTPRAGFQDDCFCIQTDCDDGAWCTLFNIKKYGMTDRWKQAINHGEFCHGEPSAAKYIYGDELRFITVTNLIRRYHISMLGPAAGANLDPREEEDIAKVEETYRALGYWFIIKKAQYENTVQPGTEWEFNLSATNYGSAPFYFGHKVELSLVKGNTKVKSFNLSTDLQDWLPDTAINIKEKIMLDGVKPGNYNIFLSIVNPKTGRSEVRFANRPLTVDNRLKLGKLTVK